MISNDDGWLRSGIGASTRDSITLCGRDLPGELMGRLTFTELAFLLVAGRPPSPGETRVLDAVLVSLADHGLTPTVLASRMTYAGAPEALQGAIAAGLLGGGSVFLGPAGDTARFLADALADGGRNGLGEEELRAVARDAVNRRLEAGERVPGLGHPVHRDEDPRVPRLYAIAAEAGVLGTHMRLLQAVAAEAAAASGRVLPINGAGAAGAALVDLGLPPDLARGYALLARVAGLLGHLAEEMAHPIALRLYREVEESARYVGGDPRAEPGR